MRKNMPVLYRISVGHLIPLLVILAASSSGLAQDDPFGEQTYPETVRIADYLQGIEPATVLEVPLEGEAADLLEFLPPGRILAGVVVVDGNSAPDYGPVYLIDTASGNVLWEHDRDDLSGGSYSLLSTEPLILLLGVEESSVRIIALDPATGRKVWDQKEDTPYGLAAVPGQDRLLLAFRDGSSTKARMLEIATGDELYETELPSGEFMDVPGITVHADESSAYLIGSSVVKVDLTDGSMTGSTDIPLDHPEAISTIILSDGFLIRDPHKISYFDRTLDRVRWTETTGNPIQAVTAAAGGIVTVTGDGRSDMALLDPETGQRLWSHSISGMLVSPVVSDGDLLIYSTDSTLVGVNASNGGTAFVTTLPDDMAAGSPSFAEIMGLPDVMWVEDGELLVARERAGIAAFALPGGENLWYREHYEAGLPLINYTADGRYASFYLTMVEQGRIDPSQTFQPPPSLSAVNREGASHLLSVAQQRYDNARARYDAGTGDALDVRIAAGGQIVAQRMDMLSGQVAAGLELAQSIVNFGIALREFRLEQGRQGVINRMKLAFQGARRAQENLFQSGYYLRPFYMEMWGRGVTLIETSTGRRRDIIFSPHNPPALAYGLDMPTFALDGEGERLAVFGISLDSDSYERRSKWGTHIPNYSLLLYDLEDLELYDHPTFYPALEPAITAGDREQIQWLLNNFENREILEWRNQAGETPIFYAVVMGMPDIVELLIDKGADVNAVCDAGMTPIEMPYSSQEIRDLLLDAGARTASGEVPTAPETALPPLMMAVCSNQIDEVQRLIDSGEDVNWRQEENGMTYLFIAVAIGDRQMVQLLIDSGADVNAVSSDGQTPMDLALTEEIRNILLEAGARAGN